MKNSTIYVSTAEMTETKAKLANGVTFENESAGYFITLRKDGVRLFMVNGDCKFFKNENAFIRATVRMVKRGF